ncbi:2-succinyl-5-enolpyruvyl-6-hydroxy-3-cyclohexene-1-carboxylic-acid synthase [Leadbetterella byssophila]|uniref:2-succinyl-5-enolpyruvyl-6-hydroxy-3- cyclohexene-1-carboxylic-acid synthase n=1 Tax=Leadbetterella byssophila TaxID=316068 RepID=UPI0039A106CB
MALLSPLYSVADICASWGVEDVIICPGSRSAALTLAFNRNGQFRIKVITDERSAAFVGLGLAQQSGKPVVLICTSGTAVLNFAPAVTEAFFQKVPLLILSADRPPEWINQYDGQTIYQSKAFGKHIVKDYDFPADYTHPDAVWSIERQTNEALAHCRKGPVHINIPIREPFYPLPEEKYEGKGRYIPFAKFSQQVQLAEEQVKEWSDAKSILVAIGQNTKDLEEDLARLVQDNRVILLVDVISNVGLEKKITSHDLFLSQSGSKFDLLVTLGKSFISKTLKQFFRKNPPRVHWHVEEENNILDPFQSITVRFPLSTTDFLKALPISEVSTPSDIWIAEEKKTKAHIENFISKAPFGELKATATIFEKVESKEVLHLGNSMPVRYGNLLQGFLKPQIKVYSNRGTSGIDGIVSTAIGQALGTEQRVHCIVGDISFFYDSNALFAAKPKNLKVYVIQNGGGNIFRIIDGPSKQAELEQYFITPQNRSAEHLAKEAGFRYYRVSTQEELEDALNQKEDVAALFEIIVDGVEDAKIFKHLKSSLIL